MKVRMVFSDWTEIEAPQSSVYDTEEGVRLWSGDFHSGTIFDVDIELQDKDVSILNEALRAGYTPHFFVIGGKEE